MNGLEGWAKSIWKAWWGWCSFREEDRAALPAQLIWGSQVSAELRCGSDTSDTTLRPRHRADLVRDSNCYRAILLAYLQGATSGKDMHIRVFMCNMAWKKVLAFAAWFYTIYIYFPRVGLILGGSQITLLTLSALVPLRQHLMVLQIGACLISKRYRLLRTEPKLALKQQKKKKSKKCVIWYYRHSAATQYWRTGWLTGLVTVSMQ